LARLYRSGSIRTGMLMRVIYYKCSKSCDAQMCGYKEGMVWFGALIFKNTRIARMLFL
jgi:hypothetical protein